MRNIGIADLASNLDQLKYWMRVGDFNIYTTESQKGKIERINEGQYLKR